MSLMFVFCFSFYLHTEDMFDAVAQQSTAASRVVDSIPARDKHFYDLQVVVLGWVVNMDYNYVCECTQDTRFMYTVGQSIKIKPI